MKTKDAINIGFLGFGTVGGGAARILTEHHQEISSRCNIPIKIKAICSRNIDKKDTAWLDPSVARARDAKILIEDPEIDIIVEAIGGLEPAQTYIKQAFDRGKSVVTANKLLLAATGDELPKAATAAGVNLGIEAAVAGGIPIINAIREGLAGEKIASLHGILNGTTNYILTEMEKTGRPFAEILANAQNLGYAEADPSLDIDGLDARDKLAILIMLSFGRVVTPQSIPTQGISRLMPVDFIYGSHLGYTIRLICSARIDQGELAISVGPTLVPRTSILAKVDGSFNAILITGESGGRSMYYGRGAGGGPTGIAVVSDIIRMAREMSRGITNLSPTLNYLTLQKEPLMNAAKFQFPYSLRFIAKDRPGIIARLAEILAKHQINIDAVLQEKSFENKQHLPFVITLEAAPEDAVKQAIVEMDNLDFLTEPPLALKIEEIG
jgi:homoserine dehydrogenase